MEFDKSKVFTSLNADELKVGSKVICANNIDSLKCKVHDGDDIIEVKGILEESYERRFQLTSKGVYPFAYLVEPPEEKKLRWTDLKVGDIITSGNLTAMITEIDKEYHIHICAGHKWYSDEELEDWEKVEE